MPQPPIFDVAIGPRHLRIVIEPRPRCGATSYVARVLERRGEVWSPLERARFVSTDGPDDACDLARRWVRDNLL